MPLTLQTAFDATEAEVDGVTYSLRRERITSLRTSGPVGAADPLTSGAIEAFEMPGHGQGEGHGQGVLPVELLLATRDDDTRVALARVVFREGVPARFALALKPGQDIRALRTDERFGYGVDAGTGCFAEAGVRPDGDAILAQFDQRRVNTWAWAATNDDRCISFSSGYGDGVYSSYFAVDEHGEPMCLVTDFGVIDVDLPRHATDDSFRAAEAERLAQLVFDRLPWLGGERHGEVWTAVAELGELREAGESVVPRLIAALVKSDSEVERDVLAHAVGKLLVSDRACTMFLDALPSMSDEALTDVLRKWRHDARSSAPRALVDALAARWDAASEDLRWQLLGTIEQTTRDELHPAFARFATETIRASTQGRDRVAGRAALDALDPYRRTAWREDRTRVAKNTAPAALLDLLPDLVARCDDDELRRNCFDVLALQGRADLVAAILHDAKHPARLAAAMSLDRDPTWRAKTNAVFRDVAGDCSRSEDERFNAVSRLSDPNERCAGLLALGMDGFVAAPVQLQYMAREAHDPVITALDTLARDAPDASVRKEAAKVRKRMK